ncbi:MAG: hypothetical protein ACJ8EQ_03095 [Sphingomicrobium sp.]
MKSLFIGNKSTKVLKFMIEPIGDQYALPVGDQVRISGVSADIEIFAWDDNRLTIWVADVVSVKRDDEEVKPI